jgi:hypothetical protein
LGDSLADDLDLDDESEHAEDVSVVADRPRKGNLLLLLLTFVETVMIMWY